MPRKPRDDNHTPENNGSTEEIYRFSDVERLTLENLLLRRDNLIYQIQRLQAELNEVLKTLKEKVSEIEKKTGGTILDGSIDLEKGECIIKK